MHPRVAAITLQARQLGEATRTDGGALDALAAPLRRPLDRRFYARQGRLDDLAALGASVSAAAPAADGPRVLISSLRMWTQHNAHELVLAHALRLRGADVHLLTCGGGMPICEVGWGRRKGPRPCDRCAPHTDALATGAGYPHHRLADAFAWGGNPRRAPRDAATLTPTTDVEGAAMVSAAWLTKSSDSLSAPDGPAAVADYAVSAGAVERAAGAILDAVRPDVVVQLNGLFAAERTFAAVAEARGIAVVSHEMAPRAGTIIFGRHIPAPDMDTDALWADAREHALTAAQAAALDEMVVGRAEGNAAHERYFDVPTAEEQGIRAELGIDAETPIIAAFTNLAWDTAVLGKDLGFASMFDWLAAAVRAMEARPDAVLVIRVHPAEVKWGTTQPVGPALDALVGALPGNVRLVGPEQAISSYTLMAMAERVLTYSSTVGLETALRGTPVAVAAATHYRGRGFTDDVQNAEELRAVIAAGGDGRLGDEELELARRYAFAFFFRLMIPFRAVEFAGAEITRVPTAAAELAVGADPYLDFICARLLDGGDVVLPRELALAGAA